MVARMRDRDIGYKSMRKRMDLLQGSYTKVGIQAGAKDRDGVTDLVIVAAANEFGTARIPERSFLRSTFEEQRENLRNIAKAEADAVLAGTKTVETSLALMGEYFVGKVQAKIHSHPPPPNAPETIARKQSSGTLIDSGQMVQSIRHVEVIQGRNA